MKTHSKPAVSPDTKPLPSPRTQILEDEVSGVDSVTQHQALSHVTSHKLTLIEVIDAFSGFEAQTVRERLCTISFVIFLSLESYFRATSIHAANKTVQVPVTFQLRTPARPPSNTYRYYNTSEKKIHTTLTASNSHKRICFFSFFLSLFSAAISLLFR